MKFLRFVSIALAVSILSSSLVANAGLNNVSSYATNAVADFEANGILDGYSLPAKYDAKRANVVAWMAKSLGYSPVTGGEPTYSDVPKSHPAFGYIEAATNMGLIQGDTDKQGNLLHTFRPNSTITRAEVAKMLVVEYQLFDDSMDGPGFSDVKKGKWYYEFVRAAASFGIAEGFKTKDGSPTGKFGPNDPVSNQEAVVMMYRAAHLYLEDDMPIEDPIETTNVNEPVDVPIVEPVKEVVSENSDGWVKIAAPAVLPSVDSISRPSTATSELGGLYGDTSYSVYLPDDGYVYEGADANVHEIYLLEDTDDGLSAFQTAQAIYDSVKDELEKETTDGYCTVKSPKYDKVQGDVEFVTLSYIAICSRGLDTDPWGEFTYAFAEVGANKLMLVQFFNAFDVQLPGGAGVDETLTVDWKFVSDFLKKIEVK